MNRDSGKSWHLWSLTAKEGKAHKIFKILVVTFVHYPLVTSLSRHLKMSLTLANKSFLLIPA